MRFPLGLTTSMASHIVRNKLKGNKFTPLVLMLEPLFACNLTCSTCGRIREYQDRISDMLSVEECLESVKECGAPIVSVCGGEPLIYPAISELIEHLVAIRKYIYLCTNGTLLSNCLHKLQPSKRLMINVHVDGPREIHDLIVERPGAFEAAIGGIKRAVAEDFQVTVNTTVCKQTDMEQIESLMHTLTGMGVRMFMLSPAYSYESIESRECFMSREDVYEKFRGIETLAEKHKLADTPIYLEFLRGKRELECTAWGNPTRNRVGWRSPCYLVADHHFPTYRELIENTRWEDYGVGRDPRCRDCMVHCGFEPTVALMLNRRQGDLWKMIKWQLG